MPRMSKFLMSPKGLQAPVAEVPDESDAQESAESPTVRQAETEATAKTKKQKQPATPSIGAMIKMAAIKRNRG